MGPVTLSLVLATAPASPQLVCHTREAEADAVDPRERGQALAAAADACREEFEAAPADDFDRRSYLAFEAERIYRKADAAGGADRPLCAARRVLEAFAASLATLPPDERPHDRQDVEDALQDIATRQSCEPVPARDAGSASTAKSASDADEPPAVKPAEPPRPIVKPAPKFDSEPASEALPGPARQRRPLRVAGWTTFGVGVGLGLGGVGALIRGAVLHQQVAVLNAAYGNTAVPRDQAVDTEAGKRSDRAAVGLLIAGPALAIAGGALLAVDAVLSKRGRPVALHPTILPAAGLRFRLEF